MGAVVGLSAARQAVERTKASANPNSRGSLFIKIDVLTLKHQTFEPGYNSSSLTRAAGAGGRCGTSGQAGDWLELGLPCLFTVLASWHFETTKIRSRAHGCCSVPF